VEGTTSDKAPRLPAAYAPFAPVLARLSAPFQQLLHGQLLQFERLARSLDAPEFAPQGEFEGLGGLTMRGDISHIVQSELLLRTEVPLEFLRRVADSETLYLEKQYADPGTRPVFRVMISVGPALLGHGRLIGLATLFFLARVALARGAAFHWCFLPRGEGAVWFDEISVNTIKRFLRAVSYREMTLADVAAAHEVWTGLVPDATPVTEYRDWVIGADPPGWRAARGARDDAPAVGQAANALSFTLLPPRPDEQRVAVLSVRQGGRLRHEARIDFPDDRVCVSALESPFAPLKPGQVAKLATAPRGVMTGWAPEYFIVPRTNARIIRTPGGLLVLTIDNHMQVTGRWFVTLSADVQLAGLGLNGNLLSIATHSAASGTDMMSFCQLRLNNTPSTSVVARAHNEVPSAHLFRKQRPFALPLLSIGLGTEIYAVSGQAFHFQFGSPDGSTRFTMLHKTPRTLYSNGVYRVVQVQEGDAATLRVVKHRQSSGEVFVAPADPIRPERLFGMAYSAPERSLAYSVMPNIWTIAPRHGAAAVAGAALVDHDIELAPHETLLSGHIVRQRVSARVWSDARHGGDGTVRSIRRENGETTLRQPVLKLGDDALSIASIQIGDDGIWAIKVDEDGAPAELLAYRSRKNRSRFDCTRFDLGEQVEQAMMLGIGPNDD
jgi:hypothetical protein